MPGGYSRALCLVILHLLNLFTASKQRRQTAGQAAKKREKRGEKKDTNIHTLQTVLCLPFELCGIKEMLSCLRFVSSKGMVGEFFF